MTCKQIFSNDEIIALMSVIANARVRSKRLFPSKARFFMISVVIPLYNKSHTIKRTLASVLAQTFEDFEVVIVNDGSKDDGVQVIRDFTSDPRVRIVEQFNQGVSVARNNGVAAAKWEWIAFLDGDDEWYPDYLKTVKAAMDRFPDVGMICSGRYENMFGPDGTEASSRLAVARKYAGKIQEVDYFENPHVFTHTSTSVVRKDAFHKAGQFPPEIKYQEDFALFYSVGLVTKVAYCGFPLGIYWGGVAGQATSQIPRVVRIPGYYQRFNRCHDLWEKLGRKNATFPIFEKYEMRACFLGLLREGDIDSITLILDHLDSRLARSFPGFELALYRNPVWNRLAMAYVYLTKLLWRTHGFPVVG
ncbi:MAG: glycosyltransferase family 2 protein [Fibrobacterota bacterium]